MSDQKSARDTRGSDEEAQRGLRFLQIGFVRLTALEHQIESLEATRYNPLPDQVIGLLVAATDHLRAVQVTVENSGGKILAMALFTRVRSAIEMSGTGLWILAPKSRDERVLRSFALTWDNRRQVRSVKTELGQDAAQEPGFNRMQARVEWLIDQRPGISGTRIFKVESVTGRLRSISDLVPDLVEPPLILRQMASGIAHGNTAMMQGVLA
jgi:hypothetical protein